jgi:hypothetical protein
VARTSEKPPAKSEGGNGAFVGVAVAMLLIGGGLVYWKLGSRAPEPEPAAPSTRPTVEEAPVLEAPPPPPPSAEEPTDAGAPEEAKKRMRDLPDPCKSPCDGQMTSSLSIALSSKGGQARACYERALRTNNTLQGKMSINVRVGRGGQVCSAAIGSNALGDPGVANCVLGQFQAGSFPPPQGGCIDARVPLNFVPKKQ